MKEECWFTHGSLSSQSEVQPQPPQDTNFLLPPNNDRSQRSASVSIPRGKHWIYYIHTLAALINEQPGKRKKKNTPIHIQTHCKASDSSRV